MSTIKEKLVECTCGNHYPIEEVVDLYGGGYVHNEDLDDFVQLDEACGESELSNGGLWCHIHDAIEVDCDNSYYPAENYHDFDIDWCHYNETYMYTDNMYWGYVSRRNEGWFCNESTNYCYSERDDVYFMDDDVARDRDYEYCESSDDYLHVDDIQESSSEWDNTSDTANLCKKYRKTFGMPYTFGVEIETSSGYLEFDSSLNAKAVYDGSINGKEYVTGCMSGDGGVNMLQRICQEISHTCYVDSSCGVHVHIGGANFNRRFSISSVMLGVMLEKEIFSMMPPSRLKSSYCLKIPDKFYKLRTINKRLYPRTYKRMLNLLAEYVHVEGSEFSKNNNKKLSHPGGRYASSRYKWLNLNNCSYNRTGPNTIEFRCHGGSKDFTKIYNWLLICMCFVKYVENNSRDIINSYNDWFNKAHDDYTSSITLDTIIKAGLGKKSDFLIQYIHNRMEKFSG